MRFTVKSNISFYLQVKWQIYSKIWILSAQRDILISLKPSTGLAMLTKVTNGVILTYIRVLESFSGKVVWLIIFIISSSTAWLAMTLKYIWHISYSIVNPRASKTWVTLNRGPLIETVFEPCRFVLEWWVTNKHNDELYRNRKRERLFSDCGPYFKMSTVKTDR